MKPITVACFTVLIFCVLVQVESAPKKKKGSSGGGWFSSSNTQQKNSRGVFGSDVGRKKSSKMKTLKKVAIVGAGAYAGYQIGKATSRFGHWGHRGGWGYNDYDRWRQQDGMLCRSSLDCSWMDPNMHCEDYELNFTPMQGWFGGDYLSIVGECECDSGMRWNNWELMCEYSFFATIGGVVAICGLVVLCLCCGGGCAAAYCFFKRR